MAVLHWQVSPQTAWHVENISYLLVMLLRPHMFCLSSYVQARSGDIKQHLWWCSLPCNSLCAAASGHVLFNWLFSKAQIGFILWCSGQSWGHVDGRLRRGFFPSLAASPCHPIITTTEHHIAAWAWGFHLATCFFLLVCDILHWFFFSKINEEVVFL